MSSNVRKTGFPWEKHAVKTRIWYAGEGRKSRHGRKGRIMQSRGSWSPCLLMGRRFFHKTLPGLPIYPVLPAGFIRDIKEALLFSSMTRSCVASVAVSPYNLSRNQNHCPGVCFHVYFPRLVARKILMESEAGTPVTIRFWFIFDYRELAGIRLFLRISQKTYTVLLFIRYKYFWTCSTEKPSLFIFGLWFFTRLFGLSFKKIYRVWHRHQVIFGVSSGEAESKTKYFLPSTI